jgi:hypothetical protein
MDFSLDVLVLPLLRERHTTFFGRISASVA